jgi:hypothetical protein
MLPLMATLAAVAGGLPAPAPAPSSRRNETPEQTRRRVVERMFVELREDKRFASVSDEVLRDRIENHLEGNGLAAERCQEHEDCIANAEIGRACLRRVRNG